MSLVVCVRAKCLKKSNVKTVFQNFLQTLNKTNPKHERQKKEEKTRSGLSSKTTGVCVCARARADRDSHKKKARARASDDDKSNTRLLLALSLLRSTTKRGGGGAPFFSRRSVDIIMSGATSSSNPFAKADRWRKHPLLTQTYKHMFPGFFLGAAMFGIYYASEKVKGRKKTGH